MHHFNEAETQWTYRGPWAFYFYFDKNFSKDDTKPLDKDGFDWIALKLLFQG